MVLDKIPTFQEVKDWVNNEKADIYVQDTEPTMDDGDIWVDTS